MFKGFYFSDLVTSNNLAQAWRAANWQAKACSSVKTCSVPAKRQGLPAKFVFRTGATKVWNQAQAAA